MNKRLSTEPYKGVRDFYPVEWARIQTVFASVRETLQLHGYQEYAASPLEPTELYENKGNEEIITEQTYSFIDRGERRVTLRPEMTPTLARMVAAKRKEYVFPLRWFSLPNVFRYERPQKGRLREHYQINVDLIGDTGDEGDAELLSVVHALFTRLGATEKDFTIRINSRTLLSAAIASAGYTDESGMRDYLRLLDKKNKLPAAEFKKGLGGRVDPLTIIETANSGAVKDEKEKLLSLIEKLSARGITNVVFSPEIARGFDYYTGMVFEVFDTDKENPKALAGGGRYDELVSSLFGGDTVPMIGFGLGDVTLLDFLETHKLIPEGEKSVEVFIATAATDDIEKAVTISTVLRRSGISAIPNLRDAKIGKQFEKAHKQHIPLVITVGEQERASGVFKIKILATGKEVSSSEEELSKTISSLLS